MSKFKFGVEYTFVPTRRLENKLRSRLRADGYGNLSSLIQDSNEDRGREIKREIGAYYAGDDDGALEIPSNPMTHLGQHREWVEKLFKKIREAQYVARRIDREEDGTQTVFGTGSGHIHVELPSKRKADRMKWVEYGQGLTYIALNAPFLGWFMNEWMDDENADCLHHRVRKQRYSCDVYTIPKLREFVAGMWTPSDPRGNEPMYDANLQVWTSRPRPKPTVKQVAEFMQAYNGRDLLTRCVNQLCGAIRIRVDTVEFRCIDAPRSPAQAMEHIQLVKRIHEVCSGKRKRPVPLHDWSMRRYNDRQWKQFSRDEDHMIAEWKKFITDLGLPWTTYKKYVQNYIDRRDFGTLN